MYVLGGESFARAVKQTGTQTVQNLGGAKKNDRKDTLIYRKWQGAIKCLHKKQCLQSNRSFSNRFTKQKDLEAFTIDKRNPNNVKRRCTHFRIKLYHTVVNTNGLRYVQLKWCLLKWLSHESEPQTPASYRKLEQKDLSLSEPPPLHGSVFPLHSAMLYTIALLKNL